MMSENRFRVNDLVKYDYSQIGEYIDENHTDRPLRNDEVCDLLNEQQYLLNNQNELLDEIFTIFQRYGIDTGYNKRILEIALENLTNGDA